MYKFFAIGGLGGSGTRVYSEIMISLDLINDKNVNRTKDELSFKHKIHKKTKNLKSFIENMEIQNKGKTNWGWKEPNTHLHLIDFLKNYENFKFIYVLRNPMDMVFSKNKNQVRKYNKKVNGDLEVGQLDFWLKSLLNIEEIGRTYSDRIIISTYDNICYHPKKEILRLCDFIDFKISEKQLLEVSKIPIIKKNINVKHLGKDLTNFENVSLSLEKYYNYL